MRVSKTTPWLTALWGDLAMAQWFPTLAAHQNYLQKPTFRASNLISWRWCPGIATEIYPPGDPSVFSSLRTCSETTWEPKCCIFHTKFLNRTQWGRCTGESVNALIPWWLWPGPPSFLCGMRMWSQMVTMDSDQQGPGEPWVRISWLEWTDP